MPSYRERQMAKAAANRAAREAGYKDAKAQVKANPVARESFVDRDGKTVYKDELEAWQATRKGSLGGMGGSYEHQKLMATDDDYYARIKAQKKASDDAGWGGKFDKLTGAAGNLIDQGVDIATDPAVIKTGAFLYGADALAPVLGGTNALAPAVVGDGLSGVGMVTNPVTGQVVSAAGTGATALTNTAYGATASPVNMTSMTGSTPLADAAVSPAGGTLGPTAMTGAGVTGMPPVATLPATTGSLQTVGTGLGLSGAGDVVNPVTGLVSNASGIDGMATAAGAVGATGSALNNALNAGSLPSGIPSGGNPLTNTPSWVTPAILAGSSLASGWLANDTANDNMDEIGRQYDQNRADSLPWLLAGENALNQYQQGIEQPNNMYDPFEGGTDIKWDSTALENDPGYQFTLSQALQGTERKSNAQGEAFSGNILAALQDRAGGVAAQYGNQYRAADLAENNTNYNRRVGEYSMGVGRNTDQFGREQTKLNRYQGLSGLGNTTVNALGNQGLTAATSIANQNTMGAAGINDALQYGIGNYLTYQDQQANPGIPAWMRGRQYT